MPRAHSIPRTNLSGKKSLQSYHSFDILIKEYTIWKSLYPPSIFSCDPTIAARFWKPSRGEERHDCVLETMLKPVSQHRSSPASSPIFHYAPTSHSLPTSPLSRRPSNSKAPLSKTIPIAVSRPQYVDAGTQWSPRLSSKMETQTGSPLVKGERPQEPELSTVPVVASSLPPSPEKPTLKPESPGMKRRQSQDPPVPTNSVSQTIPLKRSRPEQTAVKILPAKYEFCPVEDLVVLISDMIQALIQTNDSLPLRTGVLTRFHSR